MKIIQITLFCALLWAFMPVVEDLALLVARFFFRLGDLLHLIPDMF